MPDRSPAMSSTRRESRQARCGPIQCAFAAGAAVGAERVVSTIVAVSHTLCRSAPAPPARRPRGLEVSAANGRPAARSVSMVETRPRPTITPSANEPTCAACFPGADTGVRRADRDVTDCTSRATSSSAALPRLLRAPVTTPGGRGIHEATALVGDEGEPFGGRGRDDEETGPGRCARRRRSVAGLVGGSIRVIKPAPRLPRGRRRNDRRHGGSRDSSRSSPVVARRRPDRRRRVEHIGHAGAAGGRRGGRPAAQCVRAVMTGSLSGTPTLDDVAAVLHQRHHGFEARSACRGSRPADSRWCGAVPRRGSGRGRR